MSTPAILRGLSPNQVTAVLTAYEEDGVMPETLAVHTRKALTGRGFLRRDRDGFMVVTEAVKRSLDRRNP